MASGIALKHVAGGDREISTERVVYTEPDPKPKGLDWSKHQAPPVEPKPAPEPKPRPVKRKPAGKPRASVRTDPNMIASVVIRYNAGASIQSIADTVGHSYPTIRRILADQGIEVRAAGGGRTRAPEIDLDIAIAEHQAGRTVPQIAAAHGWPLKNIRIALREAGVYLDGRTVNTGGHNKLERARPELPGLIRACYVDQGMSITTTAQFLRISENAITRIMKAHNMPIRIGACGAGDTLATYRAWFDSHPGVTAADVRAWATENGYELHFRGVIRHEILDAYHEAHP